ncbi:hypothetical protein LMG3412_04613 [Achromobacter deleyi]|nr:hypothetical protein LMG3412_04613 [Achromobacter deleyi]
MGGAAQAGLLVLTVSRAAHRALEVSLVAAASAPVT